MSSPAPPESLDPGRRLGHYEIQSHLGSGGMGAVYQALDTSLQRIVALKVLAPDRFDGTAGRSRLTREAQAASALNHPNIVTIHEIGHDAGVDFIAMERIEGHTLAQLAAGPMPPREALPIAIQIADAIAAAHAAGIVHRDLKPGNIMVNDRGLVKVLDFGIAKVATSRDNESDATETLTITGQILGTVSYMSPEQAEGREVDWRSDIFSFGCVLYEVLTGRRAFHGDTELATLAAVIARDPDPPHQFAPALPPALERLIATCLAKKRANRWQSMEDVKLMLASILADLDVPAPPAAPPPATRRAPTFVLAAAAALLASTATWLLLRSTTPPASASILRQITNTTGLSDYPALSRDGNFLAFASDRDGGNLDIWLQQIGGHDPIRLTTDEADDSEPAISADGARVAFRSERSGGGIFVVPSLGGDATLIAPGGRGPRFSPDGKWIAYWAGRESSDLIPGTARVFVVESGGGQPRQIASDLSAALYPIWSPAGDRLLVLGRRGEGPADWWTVPFPSGPSHETGAFAVLASQNLRFTAWLSNILPIEWRAPGSIVFAAGPGDAGNLWEIPIEAGAVHGRASRLTLAPGYQLHASSSAASNARFAFSNLEWKPTVWSMPLDAGHGAATGDPQPLTVNEPTALAPSLSADGNSLVYLTSQFGSRSVRVRDLAAGKAITLVSSPTGFFNPRISADGATVAYSDRAGNLFAVPRSGGAANSLCPACGTAMAASSDGKRIAFEPRQSEDLCWYDLDLQTRVTAAVRPAGAILTGARFSPDGQWIAFHSRAQSSTAQVYIVPTGGPLPVPRERWVAITAGGTEEIEPAWSPDSKLLYFLSDCDGFRCVWHWPPSITSGVRLRSPPLPSRPALAAPYERLHRPHRPLRRPRAHDLLVRRTYRQYLARRETPVTPIRLPENPT